MILCLIAAAAALSPIAMTDIPRPEHPRPDRVRADWLNLNGTWEFAETDDDGDRSFLTDRAFPDRIAVPFCRESSLSGLGRTGFVKNVWYRRTFERPKNWTSERTLLHIGACDWRTTVWLNGERVGSHTGGSASFAFEITDRLIEGSNTVVIHAYDDARSGLQALGKQARTPQSEGIFYTRTTGIWQTVWLEGVGAAHTSGVRIEPDVAGKRFFVEVEVDGTVADRVRVTLTDQGKTISTADAPADWRNPRLVLPVPEPRLWQPSDPHLYDFRIELLAGDRVLDRLDTYSGLRSVSIRGHRLLLNGKPDFQRLVLDQGFYPDGIWTAPTEEALKRDIELSMAVGFNGARLHQKVFEPRFLYWADRLGYLVWGELPNYGLDHRKPAGERPVLDEWNEVVSRDRNHPAIIGWCPFNETPAEAGPLQDTTVRITRQLDPSRPVIDTSGWTHSIPDPEVLDAHDYDQNPESFRRRWTRGFGGAGLPTRYGPRRSGVPFMVSEYGGIGWNTGAGWGYGNPPKTLDEFYERLTGLTSALTDQPLMFGYCYTQLTDVEQERNGIYAYDRTPKFDAVRLRAIFGAPAAYERDSPLPPEPAGKWQVLVGSRRDPTQARPWRYSIEVPGNDWNRPNFDSMGWRTGLGAFGQKEGFEQDIETEWRTSDIWLRTEFDYDGDAFDRAFLAIHYDNATEVFLNGKEIWRSERGAWNDEYEGIDVTETLREALVKGKNHLAVHCHQDTGGQFIDLAVLLKRS
ncbi:MAG TPA: glycoside hydrolase family 2 TIM barrel-domain containing protein [Fimbriimonadaceae bacterium]|nr:glycoside hydrolase family 2 TIM barrel-domain containing protein [Fimbriimonadaceae bacterium]HRJ97353.1 glycoside hydrolase family 2 TIM barrel-domain containing protein [Fimbriimonadaceae bacterium]